MSTPQGTPVKHVRLGLASAKSTPLTNEFKRLLCDQYQRLSLKHQQDLDLIDDIRSYVKARLSIEKDYTSALQKLAKNHSNHIQKKFQLLHQLDREFEQNASGASNNVGGQASMLEGGGGGKTAGGATTNRGNINGLGESSQSQAAADQKATHQHNSQAEQQPTRPSSLYRVWSDHVNCLQSTAKNRADQFEQSNLIVDKLKDIRQHKASIGKKCLDTHLRRIQEDVLASMLDVDKAKKLYYEDESQAKKARENEIRIKKKRSGLLTKFTDLQAKKEKSSAQREATDIQSTQARNDYIMALAAANSHLSYYYYRDLKDFIHLIDDGVLDHCKIFMATLSECDLNSLKDSLSHAQYWSKLINLTGSQQTNQIFIDCEQSKCLKDKQELQFEPCNEDPIHKISLEHNADYALQHEIDKWFTWFKKECRNLSQLMHQLDTCQQAFADGKKSIEFNGQTIDDLEPKIIDLKQQIRKCEAAKLRAQARLMVIKEGGMQIEEWSAVELEIRADMARAQEEQERAKRSRGQVDESQDGGGRGTNVSFDEPGVSASSGPPDQPGGGATGLAASSSIHLQVSRDSDDSDTQVDESMHNLASVSRSTSNLVQKQQQALSGYSALTDPSLVWQDDYSSAWGATGTASQEATSTYQDGAGGDQAAQQPMTTIKSPTSPRPTDFGSGSNGDELTRPESGYDLLGAGTTRQTQNDGQQNGQKQHIPNANMSIQSSSPLSAIVNGGQHLSQSPYQGAMSEAYKSDYECDYTRIGQHAVRSAASSVEPTNQLAGGNQHQQAMLANKPEDEFDASGEQHDVGKMLNRQVIALYKFEKNNHDDLEFDEHDLLEVIEVNADDTNWVKARHLVNGNEGYVPSAYVRLRDDSDQMFQDEPSRLQSSAWSASGDQNEQRHTDKQVSSGQAGRLDGDEDEEPDEFGDFAAGASYCRALYDYAPDGDTFDEDDGLPHLALAQGELIKIIDQGKDDGWWLVEKQETGVRGHVPSMLVEEVEPDEELDDEMADDDGDVTEEDDNDDDEQHAFQEPPPDFEAPVLELAADDDANNVAAGETGGQPEQRASEATSMDDQQQSFDYMFEQQQQQQQQTIDPSTPNTSFTGAEPTDEAGASDLKLDDQVVVDQDDNINESAQDENENEHASRQVAGQCESQSQPSQPASPSSQTTGHSTYNEEFVLDKPTRKANVSIPDHQHHAAPSGHPHEPTIIEEDDSDVGQAEQLATGASSSDNRQTNNSFNGDSGQDEEFEYDKNMPAPPSVVIDSVEAIPRSPDLSFDEGCRADNEPADNQSEHSDQSQDCNDQQDETVSSSSSAGDRKTPIKQSGFVDVSPILRHHADEFTRQLIEEAIMLAPGSRIGPSTSSSDMQNENSDEADNDDEDDEKRRAEFANNYARCNHNGNLAGEDDDDNDDDI